MPALTRALGNKVPPSFWVTAERYGAGVRLNQRWGLKALWLVEAMGCRDTSLYSTSQGRVSPAELWLQVANVGSSCLPLPGGLGKRPRPLP